MRVLLSDHDAYVAAWLRNLYPDAEIVERDIAELTAEDLEGRERVHLFAGIGGWEHALNLAGWPAGRPVWTGSCPCQPFSSAGKRKAEADERHLWPQFRRLISECRPPTIFGEQVESKDGRRWLAGVRADLEALGYRFGAADLCAASAGAPHIRQRLYWVADTEDHGQPRRKGARTGRTGIAYHGGISGLAESVGEQEYAAATGGLHAEPGGGSATVRLALTEHDGQHRPQGDAAFTGSDKPDDELSVGGGVWSQYDLLPMLDGKARRIRPGSFPLATGVPARVAKLRAIGNSIVPQVAANFVRAYLEVA